MSDIPRFPNEMAINTSAVLKLLTNHEQVVAWLLLDAVCPVLLTKGGVPQEGLTAQWLQQFVSFYRGKYHLLLHTHIHTQICHHAGLV